MTTKTKTAKSASASEHASPSAKLATVRFRRGARPSTKPQGPLTEPNKRARLAAMLLRDEGATVAQMVASLGWLPHTVRAAITGLKKLGYVIDSDKIDGLRTYRAVAPK